ncbi:alpha-ketoglutarate-dependent dioxygenase AlkB family protein [Dinghuibacter silviterrae]|uniref:Alkylated DNA repair dioxygenase AlkB n=1 Tax=Dinghuibacter silviterrae TaxID=1539049 RepID=A0A4R8DHG2_9BACT|nr:alpha-ketoglutarate-dependent dioxygenase AlkB [Dinghuibacter silviterrae]TDW96975.1 alkylated DNA repair dioxygenase AlkB [Dinghuibacter silviterrae]
MIDLFTHYGTNLLPYDGEVRYFGPILAQANDYLARLLADIPWQHDQVFVQGQLRNTRRKVAWFGDHSFAYTYSGVAHHALPWTPVLNELKTIVQGVGKASFNSCLLNLYADGSEAMSWHSDNEASLGVNTTIASLSLGAERRFLFRHKKTRETVEVFLEQGSLLVMKGETQTHWLHSLPVTAKINKPRVNLTFRTFLYVGE